MATDYFLKIDGIAGEAEDKDHLYEIEINGFQFGMSSEGTIGGQGGAALAHFTDITLNKEVDASSTELLKVAAAGTQSIAKAILSCRKSGASGQMEYLRITLSEVLVSSWEVTAAEGGGIPQETLTLNYARMEITYWPQSHTGIAKGQKKVGWDRQKNRMM